MELISFKNWMKKSLKEQKELQKHDFSDWEGVSEQKVDEVELYLNSILDEKISKDAHKKLMKHLKNKLEKHDWWYSMADSGVEYRKGEEESKQIDKILKLTGTQGKKLWTKYAKKAGVIGTSWAQVEELSPEKRKKKEIELDALLKKQQEIDDEVKKLESEIVGDKIKFTKVYVEDETKPTQEKVKVATAQNKSVDYLDRPLFPDMDRVERNISLGVDVNENGYVLPNGGHHFADSPWDTTTKWEPPSDARKKRMNK
tara:strand:- start:292 stop:1062 length:771 start_codon:yes stop_codon:yes gene_type:complete